MENFHQEITCQQSKQKGKDTERKSEHFAVKRMKVEESPWKQDKTVYEEKKKSDENSEELDINRWVLLRKQCLNNLVKIYYR